MPRPRRLLAGAVAALVGLGAGLVGSFVHAATADGLPVGLLSGLGLSLAVFVTAGLTARSRGPVACAALGWASVVLVLSVRRPEGDLVVPGTGLGYAWVLGGMVVAAAAVSWPYASTAPSPPGR